jgi:hypothetical protein
MSPPPVPFAVCFMLASCLNYPSILMMETTCSAEMSVAFQLTTQNHIQEHRIFLITYEETPNPSAGFVLK